MKNNYFEIGQIVGTHGVKGMVRIKPWCDGIGILKGVKKYYLTENGNEFFTCQRLAQNGQVFIAAFNEITNIDDAKLKVGTVLYAVREDLNLEKGSYFIKDIIGCVVLDSDTNKNYGTITDVSKTGANDVWHINNSGKEYLIPVIPSVVKNVDIEKQEVKITPLKGIFEDED